VLNCFVCILTLDLFFLETFMKFIFCTIRLNILNLNILGILKKKKESLGE
jgi:hypothetical protein